MLNTSIRAFALVAVVSMAVLPASATILIVSAPTITPNGPNDFTWDYDVFLAAGSELLPPGSACTSTVGGASCDGLLTVYDFTGYIGGSIATTAAGWVGLAPVPIGVTPLGLTPTDGAALNLSWAYTALTPVTAGGTPLLLGTFSARSTFDTTTFTDYAARSVVQVNGQPTRATNVGTTTAPTDPSMVPEPGAIFLIGTALLGIAWLRSHRSRDD